MKYWCKEVGGSAKFQIRKLPAVRTTLPIAIISSTTHEQLLQWLMVNNVCLDEGMEHGLQLSAEYDMPANNKLLVFTRNKSLG